MPLPSDRFLVVGAGLHVVVAGSGSSSELSHCARWAAYDAERELAWARCESELVVVDLRASRPEPVSIVRGVPESTHLDIVMGGDGPVSLQPERSCDSTNVSRLEWTQTPRFLVSGASEAEAPLELLPRGQEWLAAELARLARPSPPRERFQFADRTTSLPGRLLDCDDALLCGKTLNFGSRGWELVLVRSRWGADCNHYACLLRDPRTGLFATPPNAPRWEEAAATEPGTCGPFLFNDDASWFSSDRKLCGPDGACRDLEGRALGWLAPGPIVGEPSIDF